MEPTLEQCIRDLSRSVLHCCHRLDALEGQAQPAAESREQPTIKQLFAAMVAHTPIRQRRWLADRLRERFAAGVPELTDRERLLAGRFVEEVIAA